MNMALKGHWWQFQQSGTGELICSSIGPGQILLKSELDKNFFGQVFDHVLNYPQIF